jgi:hypothetical protein
MTAKNLQRQEQPQEQPQPQPQPQRPIQGSFAALRMTALAERSESHKRKPRRLPGLCGLLDG